MSEKKNLEDIEVEEKANAASDAEETAEKEETAESAEKAAEETAEAESNEAEESAEEADKKDPRDAKIEELNDKHVRLMAEFENFRKRSEKEKVQMFETGARSVIEKILPIVDNFERALQMAEQLKEGEEAEADPFMDGMEKVYKQLQSGLEEIGVKPIDAVGQEFNPDLHNAVMQEETDEYESGIICKELLKGYTYRETVVRHSMVSVAQ